MTGQTMGQGIIKSNRVHLDNHEYATVRFLASLGYDIELIPPSRINGLRTPDIIMCGIPWEMKAPLGDGRKTIKNTVQIGSKQSSNLIMDLRRCRIEDSLSIKEILRQFHLSKRIRRVLIITKEEELLDFRK